MKAIKRRLREKGIKGSQNMAAVMEYDFSVNENLVNNNYQLLMNDNLILFE